MLVMQAPSPSALFVGVLIVIATGCAIIIAASLYDKRPLLSDVLRTVATLVFAFGMAIIVISLWWTVEGAGLALVAVSANPSADNQRIFTEIEWVGILQWLCMSAGLMFVFDSVADIYRPVYLQRLGLKLAAGCLLLLTSLGAGYMVWSLSMPFR